MSQIPGARSVLQGRYRTFRPGCVFFFFGVHAWLVMTSTISFCGLGSRVRVKVLGSVKVALASRHIFPYAASVSSAARAAHGVLIY